MPVKVGEDWQIWCAENGEILHEHMNKAMFEKKFKDEFEKDKKAIDKPN
ncbi:MAG: hypothetical protein MR629_07290 [Helicobacter sp.]|nr:hypothetical protein [Helicobacter sp.]MDD7567662.1 hypothetical protein [Helicobacter sp.]MDY5740527.1 hypothetical protein [Helicobacter sp.]